MPKSRKPNESHQPMSQATARWLGKAWARVSNRTVRFWQDLTLTRGTRHYRALAVFCVICIVAGLGASLIWRSTAVRYAAEWYRAALRVEDRDDPIPGDDLADLIANPTPVAPVAPPAPETPSDPDADPSAPAAGDQLKPTEPSTPAPPVTEPPAAAPPPEPRPDLTTLSRPVTGPIITGFGWQYSSTFADWRFHPGVDIQAAEGTVVRATLAGRVLKVDDSYDLGLHCVIDHGGGIVTIYGNLKSCLVQTGGQVERGAQVGTVGTSSQPAAALGPHLHFELHDGGEAVNPEPYFP